MIKLNELKGAVEDGLRKVGRNKDVKEAEVFASSNRLNVLRICYASNIPSNALEEPKSQENFGISVRALFSNGKIGFGKEDSSIDGNAVEKALAKARKNAVMDNDFRGLPEPHGKTALRNYHDKEIMNLNEEKAIDQAYSCLNAALNVLERKKFYKNMNITGELNFIAERMAIANSNGIKESDETTIALATLTTIFEIDPDVSGMWFDSATKLKKLDALHAGRVSAEKALGLVGGKKVDSGNYNVVFGRVAVADLIYSRFEVGLNSVDVKATPYIDSIGKKIAPDFLNIYDDGAMEGAIGSKKVTDEGLPTGKTEIVKQGVLDTFLANDYYAKKFTDREYAARNGFRSGGGGRHYDAEPGISPTNTVIKPGKFSDEELIREVKNGIYIGRIWYSYPVNGLASADFTSTVRGDSYIIQNGKIVAPLVPNTLRINDNLSRIFSNIIGLSRKQQATIAWGQDSVVVTPEIAVKGVRLERIAKELY